MSLERAAMQGSLAELKQKREKLVLRIEGNCAAIRQGLNIALYPVDELNVPVTAEQMRELELAYVEKVSVDSRISRLEKELA